MKVSYIVLFLAVLCLTQTEAILTPKWLANNLRHLSYYPEFFWLPGLSKLWSTSFLTYLYLSFMGFFGRPDLVVDFHTELITNYYPMTGYSPNL